MTVAEQFQTFNFYSLGKFFISWQKGRFGVYHSYVDTGFCYGSGNTLEEAERVLKELNEKYGI